MPLATKISPFNAPNYDVFTPARRSDERGVVLGAPLDGSQAYVPWIGLTTVRELALKHADRVGLVPVEELRDALTEATNWKIKFDEAQAALEEAQARNDRIAGLVAEGFKVQRVMGRPKKADE
jgi:hypothetical protein